MQRAIIREKNKNIFRLSLGNLLIILYQLIKFVTPKYNTFGNITLTDFQNPNLQREIIERKKFFFSFSLGNLLIILYQLTKFETPSYNTFGDITITNFQSPNLQRELI